MPLRAFDGRFRSAHKVADFSQGFCRPAEQQTSWPKTICLYHSMPEPCALRAINRSALIHQSDVVRAHRVFCGQCNLRVAVLWSKNLSDLRAVRCMQLKLDIYGPALCWSGIFLSMSAPAAPVTKP